MSTESVFHLQLPEMDENGAYLGLPMLIDLEPLSGEDVRAWLQDLDRDEIVT